jgi:hypothetical protein
MSEKDGIPHLSFGISRSLSLSQAGAITELSVTDAWLGAVVDDEPSIPLVAMRH